RIAAWRPCARRLHTRSLRRSERERSSRVLRCASSLSHGGVALPVCPAVAIFRAGGSIEELQLLGCRGVVGLVGEHVDESTARRLIGSIHQLPELLLAAGPGLPLPADALAAGILVLGRIGKDGHG